jgi:hypothetical protein
MTTQTKAVRASLVDMLGAPADMAAPAAAVACKEAAAVLMHYKVWPTLLLNAAASLTPTRLQRSHTVRWDVHDGGCQIILQPGPTSLLLLVGLQRLHAVTHDHTVTCVCRTTFTQLGPTYRASRISWRYTLQANVMPQDVTCCIMSQSGSNCQTQNHHVRMFHEQRIVYIGRTAEV